MASLTFMNEDGKIDAEDHRQAGANERRAAFLYARASLAMEGLHLSAAAARVFEDFIESLIDDDELGSRLDGLYPRPKED